MIQIHITLIYKVLNFFHNNFLNTGFSKKRINFINLRFYIYIFY